MKKFGLVMMLINIPLLIAHMINKSIEGIVASSVAFVSGAGLYFINK